MKLRIAFIALSAFLIGALGAMLLLGPPIAPPGQVQSSGKPLIGGPFQLTAHDGRTVTEADFRGKFMLVFFGYTYCPDICPAELQIMASAMEKLGPAAAQVSPIFITVDPERDTAARLASYVASFHPDLIGLTGSRPQIDAAAKAYRIYFAKAKSPEESSDYLMDHSAFIYLMGTDGQYLTHFPYGSSASKMAEEIRKQIENQ